jgi:hypothetical protein
MHEITDPVVRNREIMYHPRNWRDEPNSLCELAIRADAIITHISSAVALGLIPETDQFFRLGIELWVGSEGQAWELAAKVLEPNRLQGLGVQSVWRRVFLAGKETAVEVHYIGIGRGPDLEADRVCVLVSVLSCMEYISFEAARDRSCGAVEYFTYPAMLSERHAPSQTFPS